MKALTCALILAFVSSTSLHAVADEPHMEKALDHLREARKQMEEAVYGLPEQKAKALEAIDEAIHHVEKAMHR